MNEDIASHQTDFELRYLVIILKINRVQCAPQSVWLKPFFVYCPWTIEWCLAEKTIKFLLFIMYTDGNKISDRQTITSSFTKIKHRIFIENLSVMWSILYEKYPDWDVHGLQFFSDKNANISIQYSLLQLFYCVFVLVSIFWFNDCCCWFHFNQIIIPSNIHILKCYMTRCATRNVTIRLHMLVCWINISFWTKNFSLL